MGRNSPSLGFKIKGNYCGNSESITFLRCPYLLGEASVCGSLTAGASDFGAAA